jgi:hypothetical protein
VRPLVAALLVGVLLAWGCSWRSGAVRSVLAVERAGEQAIGLIRARCGRSGAEAARRCLKAHDTECEPLKLCEKAARAAHAAALAVLAAKLAIDTTGRPEASGAVQEAVRAGAKLAEAVRGLR